MKLSTTLAIVCTMILLISCASTNKKEINDMSKSKTNMSRGVPDKIIVSGTEYNATYFGEQDMEQWHHVYLKREFWRLDDVYEDFKNHPKTGSWLPFDNYPMPVEIGQVFAIRYTDKAGDSRMEYLRSDGNKSDELEITETFIVRKFSKYDLVDFSADARLFVETIEATHPIFIIDGMLSADYATIREEYLQNTSEVMTETNFIFATRKYIKVLCDGHMINFGRGWGAEINEFLDSDLITKNGKLLIKGEMPEKELIAIGGVPIAEILALIDEYTYFENEAEKYRQSIIQTRDRDLLEQAGVKINEESVELLLRSTDGSECIQEAHFTKGSYWRLLFGSHKQDYIVRSEMMDGVMYVDLRSFTLDKSIDETAEAIKEQITKGTKKFIIDLRNNGGGNSMVGNQLLDAMSISEPKYGSYIRFSELSKGSKYGENEGFIHEKPDPTSAQNPNNVSLVVLTNANTYSSATMFGVWVQDGRFGKIIGEPSANAPSVFGDMLYFKLPISEIDATVSYKRFLRPDVNADQNTLVPDILVPAEEALETAREYLRGLER